MKEEEKDKEIEELEKEIERLELEYRRLLYEPTIYTVPPVVVFIVVAIVVSVIQLSTGGGGLIIRLLEKLLGSWADLAPLVLVALFFAFMFILLLPFLIYETYLFFRLNKLYRQLAEKKGGVITGFIGDSPVFLRQWSRKKTKPRRF